MEQINVIKGSNLPSRLPLAQTVLYILALDYWNAPQWAWGVVLTILGLGWIAILVKKFLQEVDIDIFASKKYIDNGEPKSKFREKLENAMAKGKS